MTFTTPDRNELQSTSDEKSASTLATVSRSVQYDLFAKFFGKPENLSNTIDLWDSIPKYSCSARAQSALRDASGRLPVYQRTFHHRPSPKGDNPTFTCTVQLQPASVIIDGERIDCYPSTDEELVEEVLRKIFADQNFGFHDPARGESWVRFSLNMIRAELANRGRTRSIEEIKRSLEILSRTVLDVTIEGRGSKQTVYTNPIINDLTRVTRDQWKEDRKAMWMVRLPGLLSASINTLTYRQFNYGVLMSLDSQLARWLHKRLSHEYTNAHLNNPYQILFSTIERDSGMLNHSRRSANMSAVKSAIEDLIKAHVLYAFTEERRTEGKAVQDCLYTLIPNSDFVSDIKAANARAGQSRDILTKAGMIDPRPDPGTGWKKVSQTFRSPRTRA
ncbi:MAG: hypothetical protein K2Y42_20530 [Hyphomicrobium sp.]|uniref:hypothetical protein n=1 Tax=Hyphomicrobium sp. TaxID=82 RepID=UPI0025BCD8EF|nr:hypothetical protein [Hyphomicrobium sp.]MBX9865136.1 hypothetical protein [Hyphomicrobium sp.]